MKKNETEYLNKLFTSSSDKNDEAEVPLVHVPEGLSEKLYAIAETTPVSARSAKRSFFKGWPNLTRIAATLMVAAVGFQFYQQQQTLKQLEQAHADLATALHYLGEANRITRMQVLNSFNDNMRNAGIKPAIKVEQDDVSPTREPRNPETKKYNRTL